MAIDSANRSGDNDLYLAHNERGWSLYRRGDYDGVLASAAEMAALDPDAPGHAYLRGLVASARKNYAESLDWHEQAISRGPYFHGFYLQAANAAIMIGEPARALDLARRGLACDVVPSLRSLMFVVLESFALNCLDRQPEIEARLTTLDDHPAIRALLDERSNDELVATIAALDDEDDLPLAEATRYIPHFLIHVVRIAALWLDLNTDRGAPLVRGLLRRYPKWRSEVECLARDYKFDAGRRALYGLPEVHEDLTIAPPPPSCTNEVTLARRDPPQQPVPPATTPATPAESPPVDPREAQASDRVSLLIQLLRGRIDELTFGDLQLILETHLGEGLAERRVRELFPDGAAEPPRPRPPTKSTS
jgi:tetratricopeptide (TPR) repeat protein